MTLPYRMSLALLFAVFLSLSGFGALLPAPAGAQESAGADKAHTISAIALEGTEQPVLRVSGTAPPTYTMYELFDPLRLVLDVASAAFAPALTFPLDFAGGPVNKVQGTILNNESPTIARLEVFLPEERAYTVERDGNDILVKFGATAMSQPAAAKATASKSAAKAGATAVMNPDAAAATTLYDIDVDQKDEALKILLRANGPIKKYRTGTVARSGKNPDRMYIDIEGVETSELPAQKKIGGAVSQVRAARRGNGVRLVFDSALDHLFESAIVPQGNGLLVTVKGGGGEGGETATPTGIIAGLMEKEEKEEPAAKAPAVKAAPTKLKADTDADTSYGSFAGYNKQRISVDFYKIDLHNVFRLIGEISGRNIIVDEGVSGSLTLALQDVPWDFALDVILNLKGLSMEERYNTLVISPKNKEFSWPQRTTDKIAFKADPVTMKKQQHVDEGPPTLIEAKGLIASGQDAEGRKDYKAALDLYEQAFAKWPANGQLAKKIAALYLVFEGMNAKAVHFAKEALRIDPADDGAALQAAVGSANMNRAEDAAVFFEKAAASAKPSREALTSYAAFAEDSGQYGKAMDLLKKHEYLYGDTLDTFIAKGRLHDKQGAPEQAVAEYRAALLSGYPLPKDLEQYIRARIPGSNIPSN